MSTSPPSANALRVADLTPNTPTGFSLHPDKALCAALVDTLNLDGLRKLRFVGEMTAFGLQDWLLSGQLGATVTQHCSVTLAPVQTRIDVEVRRLYQKDFIEDDSPEAEMPEDVEVDRLTEWIDPQAVMVESLSLALPEFPRAPGADFGATQFTEPGVAPLHEADLKPFAGLVELKRHMKGGSDE